MDSCVCLLSPSRERGDEQGTLRRLRLDKFERRTRRRIPKELIGNRDDRPYPFLWTHSSHSHKLQNRDNDCVQLDDLIK